MARPQNKTELLDAASIQYEKLAHLVGAMSDSQRRSVFDFGADSRRTEAHWQRDHNVRDVLAHLHEWHRMLLIWVEANLSGDYRPFLPPPYNWPSTPKLNQLIWATYQDTTLEGIETMLDGSHAEVLALIARFEDRELFTKAFFSWTGTTSLGSYCVSATSSHYDWAIKKLRAQMKALAR